LKYSTPRFGDRFGPRIQACFFQNNCHCMMINYTVIKTGLTSN